MEADMEKCAVDAEVYDYLRFTVADVNGISRGKTVPAASVKGFLEEGCGIYAGTLVIGPKSQQPTLAALDACKHGNANMMADPSTLHPVPWAGDGEFKVGEVLCHTHWADGTLQEACPRAIARKQIERLAQRGIRIFSAYEMEFILFDAVTKKTVNNHADAYSHLTFSRQEGFIMRAEKYLRQAGVETETLEAELGVGQFEAAFPPSNGLRAADQAFIFKHGVKEMAMQKGMHASFMSKPAANLAGNGTHFNFSLWDKKTGDNVFYDKDGQDGLSDFARYWLAGMIKHASAITTMCAPGVNCYRRFHRDWAPSHFNWDIDNRMSTIRVKNAGPKGTYMENRVPSGSCNPYLVMAAVIAAGLDGVDNKLPCPSKMDPEAPMLPHSLLEGIDLLREDTTICQALGPDFYDWFDATKRGIELKDLKDSDVSHNNNIEDFVKEAEMYDRLF